MPKKQWMRSKRCYRGILTKANIPLSNRARFVSAKNKKVRSYADLSMIYCLLVPVLARRRIIPTQWLLAACLIRHIPHVRCRQFH